MGIILSFFISFSVIPAHWTSVYSKIHSWKALNSLSKAAACSSQNFLIIFSALLFYGVLQIHSASLSFIPEPSHAAWLLFCSNTFKIAFLHSLSDRKKEPIRIQTDRSFSLFVQSTPGTVSALQKFFFLHLTKGGKLVTCEMG